ncbi:ribosome biogenesis protein NSA1 [Amborella trichopoda]|uniref:Uncharacterized protein n=1 Tax=Amborella trichopoda TaxID=13333 RepID=W1PEE7_AMBTC|nr:ribosome biogenesis protein NSA1 [Amborella trichopoda]ERN08312.1 hypothetical protein AMTR_s00156p00062990 [Amborella trichopoda]|eukprot:XP_006846637.1 ribosome biogenesis protein NSA1 [Amborella trichopoda]
MPRTSAVESPGCPPLRALSTDVLGLVKVVEGRAERGAPQVVERWGEPDPRLSVLASSLSIHNSKPILAVARKTGKIEVLDAYNGKECASTEVGECGTLGKLSDLKLESDPIVGLHLFRSSALLFCTENGNSCLRSIKISDAAMDSTPSDTPSSWRVCGSGKVACCSVDGNEKYAVYGGKGVELGVWDLETCNKMWTAKAPRRNSIGLFTPTWFTAVTFLNDEDHHKIVTGTNQHQVRLYDISAQRRPVIAFDFRESPIKVVTKDPDGHTVYIGTGSGDIANFDMRTGKSVGSFNGKCSGSIKSIARHPELPVLTSCGLDGYMRFWDVKTRQLLSAVFLKQHLTSVVIDATATRESLVNAGGEITTAGVPCDAPVGDHTNNPSSLERKPSKVKRQQHHDHEGKRIKLRRQEIAT